MTGSLSMVMIDQTVVSVALPTMQRDLGLSTAGVQWVVNAYLLSLAVLVAFGGRLADLLAAERTFRAGTTVFVLASALCVAPAPSGVRGADPGLAGDGLGDRTDISPGTTDALGAAAPSERSQASGIVQTVRQIGAAVGIAVLGAIVANVGAVAPDATPAAHLTAQTNGVAAGYWAGAAMMALMAAVAFVFVRRRPAE